MTPTPLSLAQAAVEADPQDDAARLHWYRLLADAELYLLLQAEAEGDTLSPRLFPLEDGPMVLAFDAEERLAAFAQGPAPYAALPGRIIAQQLAGQGIALGLNLDDEAAATILPPEAMDWLTATLGSGPERASARPRAFHAPLALPAAFAQALADKLAGAGHLAQAALLAGVDYDDGRRAQMLAFLGASPSAEAPLARAVAEALVFSGLDAGELDVTFLSADDPVIAALSRKARVIDLPKPAPTPRSAPQPPGTDPARPPRLR